MFPKISVVTCSYNQGHFIGRTIESVLAQDYPNLEHIIVDGMSTDGTVDVLRRYPHLRVIREPDRGQADAINKGFRQATGEIFCFLNSDDTFYPGALHRVAREIDPARGRHVVMGRCEFIDENDAFTGIEHPSHFSGHERILQVWQVNCVPQPATFWTSDVWKQCGPLDENEHLVLDFDLMCRISRRYPFHYVDAVLAGYRLHTSSKTCSNSAEKIYDAAIKASRRYWGGPWTLKYWRLLTSLALYRLEQRTQRSRRAAEWKHKADDEWRRGRPGRAVAALARSVVLGPDPAFRRTYRLTLAPLVRRFWGGTRTAIRANEWHSVPGHTTAYRQFTGAHGDNAVGPHFISTVDIPPGGKTIELVAEPMVPWVRESFEIDIAVDGIFLARKRWIPDRPLEIRVDVEALPPGPHRLELCSDGFVLPSDFLGGADHRPLVFRLTGLRVIGENILSPLEPPPLIQGPNRTAA